MKISLQLYSIKEEAALDFSSALSLVQKAGYQGVEFAGYYGNTAEQMKKLLEEYKLKAVSTHVGIQRLKEALDEELAFANALGYKLVVCPYTTCNSKAEVLENAAILEGCARKAAEQGITLGYHNHSHEFTSQFDGKYAMDILLENAPALKFQPDVFWIAVGGVDPLRYLEPLAGTGRLCALHAKELAKEGKANVYVGQGKIDFAALAKVCPPSVYPWIIEQEEFSSDHLDGITQSYQGLRRVFDAL
ncbi:MAG: sugar phosphate isomerase/epimerase [Treponema sp.]|jgi:sugar phosphate isomerase/epimerase|nr:sugar phosphate isomerase/epimerase [Treponema sp.]